MTQDGIWNLLMLSITSLTISVSVLLWFLTDYINIFEEAESSPWEREALATSTRVVIIITGSGVIFAVGCLSGMVAWTHMFILGISLWSQEFYLLSFSILLPIIGALLVGWITVEKVSLKYIIGAFQRTLARFKGKPLSLKGEIEELQLVELSSLKPLSVSARTRQDWNIALEWVERHEREWGLGKGFIRINRRILISLVARQWTLLQSENKAEADNIPQFIAPHLGQALVKCGAIYVVSRNKHLLIAEAACALYEKEAHQIRR